MRRSHTIAGVAGTAALLAVSAWLFTAEAKGTLPPGRYVGAAPAKLFLEGPRALSVRHDALRRAAIYAPSSRSFSALPEPGDAPLVCRFLAEEPTGTTAKFNCVLDGGEVIKVKYSRNSEIHAEAAASRLLKTLGFAADDVRIVPRVRCYGCPRFPFFTSQMLFLAHVPQLLPPNGHAGAYTNFEWAAVERRFNAPAIETETTEGWACRCFGTPDSITSTVGPTTNAISTAGCRRSGIESTRSRTPGLAVTHIEVVSSQ